MNTGSAFIKLPAFSLIFSVAGAFLSPFATANPDTLNRENSLQIHPPLRCPNENSLTPSVGVHEAWVARYNGSGNGVDYSNAIAVDSIGNVYVTGAGYVGPGNNWDYATIKYNPSGEEEWIARYDGPANDWDEATAIAVDVSGNVYVTGYSLGLLTGFDYATIKYNSAGQQQWVARYMGGERSSTDKATAIAVDVSGNVYVTGESGSGSNDYATIKYNAAGRPQWRARYDHFGNVDNALAIAVDISGNVYVTGDSGPDYATVKYDSTGQQQWVARYNGGVAEAIALDGLGNVYVTGFSGVGTGSDYATIKYNSVGQEQWVARYNGPGNGWDIAVAIAVDASGNTYVTGQSTSNTGLDYATIKYNSAGQETWIARYNGPDNRDDQGRAIALDGFGNVYVTGSSGGANGFADYATVKYNSAGQEQWVARYNGPGNNNDYATGIAVDGLGNVYVTGQSIGSGSDFDYATIKYVQGTTVQVTVQTNPAGLAFSVDGIPYTSTQTFTWASGSSHTIATTSPQNGSPGVRYVWTNWTGGGAISHTVAPTTNKTYTANFRTQYHLTMTHGTGGRVSPSSGWRNSGAVVSISATPNDDYSFSNWTGSGTGSYSGANNPASITMNGPITETAIFTLTHTHN